MKNFKSNKINKTVSRNIKGGAMAGGSWICHYTNGHSVTMSSAANAIANCDMHSNCMGCEPA